MAQFPNPDTQFKPGQSGNPGGLTSEQAAQRKRNRDRAIALEEKMLAALERDMTENETAILAHIRADVLRLIHTAIERVDGKPKQAIDLESPEGTLSAPQRVEIVAVVHKGADK